MKIVIAGGSGQVGHILQRAFSEKHELVILTRSPRNDASLPKNAVRYARWDGQQLGSWTAELSNADVLINLAGRSVNCRYGPRNRRAIIDSRVNSTRILGEAIRNLPTGPKVWLQASTATIYAHVPPGGEGHGEEGTIGGNESNVPATWRFSIDVTTAWERAFDAIHLPATRKIKLRSAMVMSPDLGGVFDTLLTLVKRGLGGKAGDGFQYVSWIHERDFVRALQWLLDHEEFRGSVNISAPNPLPNHEFMRDLRKAAGVRFGLPAANWMLEIGALFLRTETELILKSRRVIPKWLLKTGFTFEFPDWLSAVRDLHARSIIPTS
jgi:uncharacterized protein (TIGR01777 family)